MWRYSTTIYLTTATHFSDANVTPKFYGPYSRFIRLFGSGSKYIALVVKQETGGSRILSTILNSATTNKISSLSWQRYIIPDHELRPL